MRSNQTKFRTGTVICFKKEGEDNMKNLALGKLQKKNILSNVICVLLTLSMVMCLLLYGQSYSFAAAKPKKKIQNTQKQPNQILQVNRLIDNKYEIATNIKRIDFSIYKSNYSIAPSEYIKVDYKTGCGWGHQSVFRFDVYRLKENHNSYAFRLTGQVDTEACMRSNMININYETTSGFINIAETKENLNMLSIHPNISTLLSNNLLTDKDGNLLLLYKNGMYNKYTEAGDRWGRVTENIKSIAIDPNNEKIFYAINTRNLVQKSMDGGKNWLTINNGLPSSSLINIIVNPYNSQEVFVLTASGLYKTLDAGFTWNQTSLRELVWQVLIHPKDKTTFYARTQGDLYISKDAGTTWTKIEESLPKRIVKRSGRTAVKAPVFIKNIAFQSYDKPNLIIITDEGGILKSEDSGASWKELNNGFDKDDGAYSIYTSNSEIYIGSYGCIYHLKDDSDRWEKVDFTKANDSEVKGIVGIYMLGQGKGLIIADDAGKLIHVDKDNNLIGLNYGVMPHSRILNLKSVPGQGKLYASISNNNFTDIDNYGLFYSINNGMTWEKSLIYSAYVIRPRLYVSPHDDKEMWLFDSNDTTLVFISKDGGKTWHQPNNFTFAILNSMFGCFAFDRKDPNVKYICDAGRLFRYDGRTGNKIDLKIKNVSSLVIAEDDPTKLLANFNLSTDGGWSWKDISSNLVTDKITSEWNIKYGGLKEFKPIYFNLNKIVLLVSWGMYSSGNHIVLMSSDDLGQSWKLVKDRTGSDVFLYTNPGNPNNIFWGFEDKSGEKKIIIISQSIDQGKAWKPFAVYTPQNDIDLSELSMTIAKESEIEAIYIGTLDGLYKTKDQGKSWQLLGGINSTNKDLNYLRIKAPPEPPTQVKFDNIEKNVLNKVEASHVSVNESAMYNEMAESVDVDDKRMKDHYRQEALRAKNRTREREFKGQIDVKFEVIISEEGMVIDQKVLSTTGNWTRILKAKSYYERIITSANQALHQFKFSPFEVNDVKVKAEGEITIPVNFTLQR